MKPSTSGYALSRLSVRRKYKIFDPLFVMKRVLAGALGTEPDHTPTLSSLEVVRRFNKQFAIAHATKFRIARWVETGGDARLQHGTSTLTCSPYGDYFSWNQWMSKSVVYTALDLGRTKPGPQPRSVEIPNLGSTARAQGHLANLVDNRGTLDRRQAGHERNHPGDKLVGHEFADLVLDGAAIRVQ